jgi:hypothetical protein
MRTGPRRPLKKGGWPRRNQVPGPTSTSFSSLEVRSACASPVARFSRSPLGVWRLNDVVDRALERVHVVQSVEGADRVGVCKCPGLFSRAGARNTRSPRGTLYFTSESRAGAETCKRDCADRSHEHRPLPQHVSLPFRPPALPRRTLLKEAATAQLRKRAKTLFPRSRDAARFRRPGV